MNVSITFSQTSYSNALVILLILIALFAVIILAYDELIERMDKKNRRNNQNPQPINEEVFERLNKIEDLLWCLKDMIESSNPRELKEKSTSDDEKIDGSFEEEYSLPGELSSRDQEKDKEI
jgi:hypothetical protein